MNVVRLRTTYDSRSAPAINAQRKGWLARLVAYFAFLVLLTYAWSTIRVEGFTLFDALVPLLLLTLLLTKTPASGLVIYRSYISFFIPSMVLLVFGVLVSATQASRLDEHFGRGLSIILAFGCIIPASWLIAKKRVLSMAQCAWAVSISATCSSLFVILQARLGWFIYLIPNLEQGLQEWNRPTGLAEHPIEAGMTAGAGVGLSVFLIMRYRDKLVLGTRSALVLMIAVNLYSMNFSASLTAVIGMCAGLSLQLIASRRFLTASVLAVLALLSIISGLSFQNSSTGLGQRIASFLDNGSNYTTVQSRDDQIRNVLDRTDIRTFLLGRGYSVEGLPEGLEIHNGALAAYYHFGLLALLSQLTVIGVLGLRLFSFRIASHRGLMLALLSVFLAGYLTGPALSRRSVWIPALTMAAFAPKRHDGRRRSEQANRKQISKV